MSVMEIGESGRNIREWDFWVTCHCVPLAVAAAAATPCSRQRLARWAHRNVCMHVVQRSDVGARCCGEAIDGNGKAGIWDERANRLLSSTDSCQRPAKMAASISSFVGTRVQARCIARRAARGSVAVQAAARPLWLPGEPDGCRRRPKSRDPGCATVVRSMASATLR
jgi:hypothetical protein